MESPLKIKELIKMIENHENVSTVNTSEIKDMSELFCVDYFYNINRGKDFNQLLNDWDVSNVTNMKNMFCGATSFNQPLNDWDVSNVENMDGMFVGAIKFNQPLNEWDVSNVENMRYMFYSAEKFNQPLNDWDVSKVKDMHGMFSRAKNYTYSFKLWKLKSNCETDDFLTGCNLWHLFNTKNDLPMQKDKRIKIEVKKIWKIL